MAFTNPLALLLLFLIPAAALLGWPGRGSGREREWVSLGLRVTIILCLVLALAGLSITSRSRQLAVVFLIDESDSMPRTSITAEEEYVRQALKRMGPDDQAAAIVFGADALVERPMSAGQELGPLTSIPVTNGTDIARAVRLGMALYPAGSARRMVILSDGMDTVSGTSPGGLDEIAKLAAASGIDIQVVPFSNPSGPEVVLSQVDAPDHLRQGEGFALNLTLEANESTKAGVRVLAGDQVVYEGSLDIKPGSQSFSLPLKAGQPGFMRYTVQVSPQEDGHYQNNELAAYSQVAGPPRVLVVAPPAGEAAGFQGERRPDEASALVAALQAAQYTVESIRPETLPSELPLLAQYASVVLVDVPASDLTPRQMDAIQSYVRDLGGGLVTIGGPTSYGVGGYFRTPLEETLPVEMQIKDQQRRPTLAMVFIIDHSGSMSETSGGVTKVELAKEAAIRSIQLLNPMDRVGVIAFDESASWVVPMTDLSNPDRVINAIGTIRADGGTDILAGVQAMANVLPGDPAQAKHVILLTDGGADPTGIPELVKKLYDQSGITLSTVGVGRDAAPFLAQLAELGGGRYHFTADAQSIPSIFTEETTLATRAYIIEKDFYPKLASSSPILNGIDATPPLHGYVGTTAKSTAQTILVSDQNDPILASWQYGLGKAVAFTSDATGRWAKDWVGWKDFPTFWAQAIRYTLSNPLGSGLEARVETQAGEAKLIVAARDEAGNTINGYNLQANIVSPTQGGGNDTTTIELRQTAPGQYEGSFIPDKQGVYLIRITGESPQGGAPIGTTTGWVQSYSPEYRNMGGNSGALLRMATSAGGQAATANPAGVFAHTQTAPQAPRPAWPWLLAAAALLLPVDIASRRLVVSWKEIQRGFQHIVALIRLRRAREVPAMPRSSRLQSLLDVKEHTRQERKSDHEMSQPTPPEKHPGEREPSKSPEPVSKESPQKPPASSSQPSHESTASVLLANKRAKKKDI